MVKTKSANTPQIELEPDAWPRFERFIRGIVKAGPQHRNATKSKVKSNKSPSTHKAKRRTNAEKR